MNASERRTPDRTAVRVSQPAVRSIEVLDLVVAGFAILGALLMSFLR